MRQLNRLSPRICQGKCPCIKAIFVWRVNKLVMTLLRTPGSTQSIDTNNNSSSSKGAKTHRSIQVSQRSRPCHRCSPIWTITLWCLLLTTAKICSKRSGKSRWWPTRCLLWSQCRLTAFSPAVSAVNWIHLCISTHCTRAWIMKWCSSISKPRLMHSNKTCSKVPSSKLWAEEMALIRVKTEAWCARAPTCPSSMAAYYHLVL